MHRFFLSLSKFMAILGGLVLSALILLICISIIGRTIGIGPINGDYELVEAGIAFSIFAFLPLTQITAGHATVDIFTNSLPPKIQRLLLAIIEIFFAAMLIMVAWQLREGMFDKLERGQTTFLLPFLEFLIFCVFHLFLHSSSLLRQHLHFGTSIDSLILLMLSHLLHFLRETIHFATSTY